MDAPSRTTVVLAINAVEPAPSRALMSQWGAKMVMTSSWHRSDAKSKRLSIFDLFSGEKFGAAMAKKSEARP